MKALRTVVIESTASKREAFLGGYSNSASADGQLAMQGDESTEIDQLGTSDRKCQRCGGGSHLKKNCIAKGVEITDTKSFSKPGGRGRSGGQGRGPAGQRERLVTPVARWVSSRRTAV